MKHQSKRVWKEKYKNVKKYAVYGRTFFIKLKGHWYGFFLAAWEYIQNLV